MSKKRIISIVMLVVLAVGIAMVAYGVTGRNIYVNAAAMMGSDQKSAMTYIQEPAKLTEIGAVAKIGADNMKSFLKLDHGLLVGFLKGLGADAAAVDAAVDAREKYETAIAHTKDRDLFLAYAQSVDESVTADNLNDLIKDHAKSDPMKVEMAMKELGLSDEAEYKKLESNEALIGLYQQNLPKLLENSHMTNAVIFQFIGLVLVVAALAYFLIQAMDIKPRPKTF